MERVDPPAAGTEREQLVGFVSFMRQTLLHKCEGLGDEQLATTLPPSTMTLAGMLSHLDFVEDHWIRHVFFGGEPSEPWASAPWHEDADWDWHAAAKRPGDELRAALQLRWEGNDAAIAAIDLDAVSALEHDGAPVTLRWVLLHFIEEYSRHCGHADLIRESIDWVVGD